jgi:hypothetical protein
VGGSGVDQDDTHIGHHHAEVGVVAQILRFSICSRADQGVDVFGESFRLEHGLRIGANRCDGAAEQEAKGASSHESNSM